ncbi:MAG: type II secretion system protein [Betaproteobacteria bacterium]|nr:type II secretion system protein [Betaproteobacteria bacterium]MBV9360221.1 type II secretion system protein [Betaproteobacteria bacterium]
MNARARGFTLVELAVGVTIIALLVSSLMYTISAQSDQRAIEETRRRLEQARELILGYAAANGRLPCPARCTTWPTCDSGTYATSDEVRDPVTGKCTGGGVDDYYGGTLSSGATGGLLPAATIGFAQTDTRGYAVDAWGNRIRYIVAKTRAPGTCGPGDPPAANALWTNATNLKTYGMACQPNDLLICKSSQVTPAPSTSPSSCGGPSSPANAIMTTSLVVAIVFSTGKNGSINSAGTGADEQANLDGAGTADPIFVYHAPQPTGATGGEFDDQFSWITVGELMGRLVTAGRLP